MKRWRVVLPLVLVAAANVAAAPPAQAAPGRTGPAGTSVTLVTGDRVALLGERISVEPGPGRAGMRFLTRRVAGHVQVIPVDAMPLLRGRRLDDRLFDVTELARAGDRDAVPVILSYPDASARLAGRSAALSTGAAPQRDLPLVHGFSARVGRGDLGRFWSGFASGTAAAAGRLWLDGRRELALDVSVPMIGGPAARAAGLDGTGVKVAVLDSGVDARHPDLAGRVVAERNFTGGYEDDADHVGHGTHIASTIAGTGAASGGRYAGVAPGAQLLDGKVCVVGGCDESWILAGLQWAADQGATVVNLSLGGYDSPGLDPIEQAVQDLTAQRGILFVVAAGNDGPGAGSIGSPADVDAALAVGAVDTDDRLAGFSGRGPRAGDFGVKPDLTAPGVDIVAARSHDATGDGAEGTPVGDDYLRMSGTSMATPHVTGAAAILKQQHPAWTATELKAALMASAKRNDGQDVFAQGAGRVDIGRAVTQQVYATPPSASFGQQAWPHADDRPVTSTITYTNTGPAPVTLALSLDTAAPAGMFTLSAPALTVPAGGTAAVALTADTRAGTADGTFSGYLVAGTVRVPFSVRREPESYDLTLVHTGRDGAPPSLYNTLVMGLDNDTFTGVGDGATTTLRLPRGRYTVDSSIIGDGTATQLVQPVVDLTRGPQTVHLDARLGRPVDIALPDPSAAPVVAELTTRDRVFGGVTNIGGFTGPSFDGLYSARIGPATTAADPVTTVVGGRWARPGSDSPTSYVLYWFDEGRMDSGFARTVRRQDLAELRLDVAATVPGAESWTDADATGPGGDTGFISHGVTLHAPFTRTTYHNTEPRWSESFMEDDQTGLTYLTAPATTYQAGRRYPQVWNRAVFGPGFGYADRSSDDTVFVAPRLYGDSQGRTGTSFLARPTVTLTRDGAPVAGSPSDGGMLFVMPPGPGRYRLTETADRAAPATLSTHTEVAWTFTSSRVTARTPLPQSVVRFAPPVDRFSTAPAGAAFAVAVSVVPRPGSAAAPCSVLSVQVSYDDGSTWTAAPVRAGTVVVQHPRGAGFVSLRATATDTRGNTVEQTVIRAYRIA